MSQPSILTVQVAAAIGVVSVMALTAILAKRTRKAAYVDAAWGASFVAAAWAALVAVMAQGHTPSASAWVLLVLVSIWGVRLSLHLGRRVRSWSHDDPRYEDYLGGPIAEVPLLRVLLKVFALQALLVVVVGIPLVVGIARPAHVWWPVAVGCALWLVGVIFESVADAQLAAYRADPHRPAVLSSGLWAASRHPNYFGDFCVWWGLWLVAGATHGVATALLTVVSPVLMSWILIGISGVRLAERRMQGRPGWAFYAARTPIFIPWRIFAKAPSSKGVRAE